MPFDYKTLDTGATAWVLASAALVLFMTPGLAFFYGGMVRAKNVLGMLMQNYVTIGIVSVIWVVLTYSLSFGVDWGGHGIIGTLHFAGLANMQQQVPGYTGASAQVIPPIVFVAFQLMFAVITPALITGSTADRLKFGGFVLFVIIWSILVYAPVAHWVFSPTGFLFKWGAEDFAGGTVVHMNAGTAGLALCLLTGRRLGWPKQAFKPHNVPYVLLGAAMLWFGWFGFNAGSALTAGRLAGYAFVNTNTATAVAMLAWIGVEKLRDGHATTVGAASGAVAGLVAITPACGYVNPEGAILVGAIAGGACSLATTLKFRFGFDDSLDVVAVHLLGGALGALTIGLVGDSQIGGINGLFYGGGLKLLRNQAEAVGIVFAFCFVMTMLIGLFVSHTIGLRVDEQSELQGLDLSQHAESAYDPPMGAGSFDGAGTAIAFAGTGSGPGSASAPEGAGIGGTR